MDIMIRRAHGLVERFKSRSDMMKIDPNPPGLLTGGHWDQLNQTMWDVFSSKAQTETTYESKISIWKNIFLYIRVRKKNQNSRKNLQICYNDYFSNKSGN